MDVTQDQNGNFLNPAYVTPEQIKQLRDYTAQLQGGATAPTSKSWAGAIAQGLMGLQGAHNMNVSNQEQRQLAQQGSNELNANSNPLIAALLHGLPQGGQQPPMQPPMPQGQPPMMPPQQQGANPANMGGTPMPPGQNLTGPNIAQGGVQYGPVTGDPSFSGSPNSGAGNPISQALMGKPIQMAQAQPSNSLAPILSSPSIPAEVKKQILDTATPRGGFDAMGNPVVGTAMGGLRPTGVGQGVSTGVWKPQSVSTPNATVSGEQLQSTQGGGSFGDKASSMMDTAASIGDQGARNAANQDQIKQDTQTAFNSIPIRQTLSAMKDDIQSHGDKMVFGPSAPWLTELKRGIAQHAPGLMSDSDIAGLGAADSFDKLTAQLQSIVGRQVGGTDASLMQGMKSVPGSHNSKQGALALIDMLGQTARQNAQFVAQNQYKIGQPGFNYLAAKNQFFEQNPIVNPISGHPLRMDLGAGGSTQPANNSGGWGIKR